jgi:hypothetical protein
MVDWFALLAPLVSLPIVLLLVFVGCAVGRIGGGLPVRFAYDPGFDPDVHQIDLLFKFVGTSGGTPVVRTATDTLEHVEIDAQGGAVEEWGLAELGDEGSVECRCTITMAMTLQQVLLEQTVGKVKDDALTESFWLSRDGNKFSLNIFP